jgi:hypothetical protein
MAKFEILSGLPTYGPMAEAFSATGQGKHRQGFVVRFRAGDDDGWVGNFQPGLSGYSGVLYHPNGTELIVTAGGQAYVVDPISRKCSSTFGARIESAFEIPERNMIIFGNGLWFEAINEAGRVWRSDRISWDGMRNLAIQGSTLAGEAYDISGAWMPFNLDIASGDFTGGSYTGPDRRDR